ncbi:LacI family transcriptional regulator [Microbacterium sp. HD4P20]|nr:LacI family transcriptional regulator [Microbacterium sp. HD4P20]
MSGVSGATVSYVLNDVAGQTIPDSTRERVRAAAAQLGYVPSAAAASLRRGHSRIVLVVTEPALHGFVTEPFLTAIGARLTEGEFVPITHQFTTERALRALVEEIRPYGVLALAALSPELKADIAAAGVPRVYSSGQGDPTFRRPWEEEIGALQANYLLDGGADALLYASPTQENLRTVMARSRELGVIAVCASRGLPPPRHIDVSMDLDRSLTAVASVIPREGKVGICAFDDEIASVVLSAVQRLAMRVPDDVRVIGVDDTPFAPFLSPPLTTIEVDGRKTGRALAERFLSIEGSEPADAISHAVAKVIPRGSG